MGCANAAGAGAWGAVCAAARPPGATRTGWDGGSTWRPGGRELAAAAGVAPAATVPLPGGLRSLHLAASHQLPPSAGAGRCGTAGAAGHQLRGCLLSGGTGQHRAAADWGCGCLLACNPRRRQYRKSPPRAAARPGARAGALRRCACRRRRMLGPPPSARSRRMGGAYSRRRWSWRRAASLPCPSCTTWLCSATCTTLSRPLASVAWGRGWRVDLGGGGETVQASDFSRANRAHAPD